MDHNRGLAGFRHDHNIGESRPLAGDQSTLPASSWIDHLPRSDHVDSFKRTDWASSALGPLEDWGPDLRFVANMCFSDVRPAAVWWTRDLVGIYNESFKVIVAAERAQKHAMGKSHRIIFPTVWPDIAPVFDRAFDEGIGTEFPGMRFMLSRHDDRLEETFFFASFVPLRGASGSVKGVYNTAYECTDQVLTERRRNLLSRIATVPNDAFSTLFPAFEAALRTEPRDVTLCVIYSADEESLPGQYLVQRELSIAVPNRHHSAPPTAVLSDTSAGFTRFFSQVADTKTALAWTEADGNLEPAVGDLLQGIEWTGWGGRCKDLSIVPLLSSSQVIGFMVIATNPHRMFKGASQQFVTDLAQHIAVRWGTLLSAQNAARREKRLTMELAESEQRIRHMAQSAPVGMVQLTPDGLIQWANDEWYQLTGFPRGTGPMYQHTWQTCYTDASIVDAQRVWVNLLRGENTSVDLQLRRLFHPAGGDDVEHHAWVTALGFPLVENGQVKYIMGTLTDVSHLKWAESVQARSAEQASEAKRAQENFIDMTSHEMRNPLSAMYQCASMIMTSMDDCGDDPKELLEALKSNVEAGKTIMACASHQKRIIDDVLILNRLENTMLSITPVPIHIVELINRVASMFEMELAAEAVEFEIVRDQSFDQYNPDLVCCDPSRLTQVFINLISNAIKFTKSQPTRKITLRYGASSTEPPSHTKAMTGEEVYWAVSDKLREDLTLQPEWGTGEPLFLRFSVKDTGPGLEPHEVRRLFNRFSQANAKTHIKYGGSGLGLYISRELTEKMGGKIGILSEVDQGTVIGFYIKARRGTSESTQETHLIGSSIGEAARNQTTGATAASPSIQRMSEPESMRKARLRKASAAEKISLLLVEDNLINQAVLRKQLQKAGCEVIVANNGVEALAVLETTQNATANESSTIRLDIVLMDWEMPVMDGLACSRRVRELQAQGALGPLPIIATTANARNEQIQEALDAGADDVITKPFLVAELMDRMRRWI